MNLGAIGSIEFQMLWASAALGLVHLLTAVLFSLAARGLPWGLSNRDEPARPMGTTGARIERGFKNFLETFPLFVALVLLAAAMGKHSAMSALGAQLYFWGRLVYAPVYAFGIPVVRTLAWGASLAGIALVLLAIHPGI